MQHFFSNHLSNTKRLLSACVIAISYLGCTDPVTPDFEFREGLIFVEGFASTTPGDSFVIINESAVEFGVYVVNSVDGATLSFENPDTGQVIPLAQQGDAYIPPLDFAAAPGERWKLNAQLSNGKRYESSPELVLQPVSITNLEAIYDPEIEFREIFGGKFVPGHELLVSFDDPSDTENYYYWTYRSYENLDICEKCFAGYFRDGECIDFPASVSGIPYFDYTCESECWRIRFPESIAIYDDRFSNGKQITNLSIGNALLYTKENMVVVAQQWNLTPEAHEYYKVLKDILDNNSGLNAPPPAALIGNLFNPKDSEDFIFGRFTAAATTTASIFIDRTGIEEDVLERRDPLNFEGFGSPVPPPQTITAPCDENRFRTAIRPPGWID
ncbi:DUF4249 domain-containing protein [Maribacter halichondriae]|uniref:DUF4249 domain-containing protein n=1 Tax=Maribacter halichondriae TaxID=2980554 RepID=UPI0023589AFA|nr:DUF4249 domain-containing protein [Maribacter sp. Hal144]